jgi:holliday junction DNA helicase RuvA
MLERLEGTIQAIEEQKVVVRAGPISFGVHVATGQIFSLGEAVSLHLYMIWNQENGPSLYGFGTPLDKTVFIMITSCVGVGPKLGLATLHKLGSRGFLEAIQAGDEAALSSVSGIGEKKAEQIIVHCKHKVHKLIASGIEYGSSEQLSRWYEIDQALSSLNYSRIEVNRALDYLRATPPQQGAQTFDYLLRKALSYLSLKQ